MQIAVKNKFIVIYYDFRHTFGPYKRPQDFFSGAVQTYRPI